MCRTIYCACRWTDEKIDCEMKKIIKKTGLTESEKLMFSDFMDWFNLDAKEKDGKKFKFDDPEFQSFLINNGITLNSKSIIVPNIKKTNIIYYDVKKSKVRDLARHIRNAYAHSLITKKQDKFYLKDTYDHKLTMNGKISINSMKGLLEAIRNNKCDRDKTNVNK